MKKHSHSFLAAILGLVILSGAVIFTLGKIDNKWDINRFNNQKLKWSSCYDNFECSSFKVPIDYQDLTLGVFRIQVIKHSAFDQKHRLGSIVVNPGGPGGSGIDYVYSADSSFSKALLTKYDFIGFDGRGVGSSDPITCLTDKESDNFIDIDGSTNSQRELEKLKSAASYFADACAKKAGVKLGHISTFENAKDMEVLRNILRESKLNYLGKSYGTFLGAIYISLYPEKVGKFILDGAIDPNVSITEQSLNQAVGFEKALDDYLKTYKEFSKARIQQFIEDAGTKPMKAKDGRVLSRSLVITAIAASLYDNKLGWLSLRKGLSDAIKKGDSHFLFTLADSYNNRDANGHYYNNQNDIGIAIDCLDWNSRKSAEEIAKDVPKFVKASQTFGRYISFSQLPCTYWKAPPVESGITFKDVKSPPFVIIGVTKDPATPYIWSQNLAKVFPSSVLLTFAGEGHTGHNRGNSCIDSKVDAFFLQGKLPEAGATCVASGN
ncbi:MAG: hypothetical protein RL129_281 [Actinomycetota bacterium]